VIQWMLDNGWPSLIWHLYDYYLVPAGGYFGTKKAMEIAHVQYSYDDNSVAVVNGFEHPLESMKVTATIYGPDGKQLATRDATLNVDADGSAKAMDLPPVTGLTGAYFLNLEMVDSTGQPVSSNFYWLSTKPDVIDFAERKDTVYTPESGYADLTSLQHMPEVKLVAHKNQSQNGTQEIIRVTVQNPGKHIAFMVHLRLTQGKGGEDVVPIFWQDNYFSLLPGQQREVSATYDPSLLNGKKPVLLLDAWNAKESTVSDAK